MKVKILEAIAGNADERYGLADFSFRPGEEIELDDALAAAWIESGRAAAVEERVRAAPAEPEDDEPEPEEEEPAPEVKNRPHLAKKTSARHKR